MCEGCAPDAHEHAAKLAAHNAIEARVAAVQRANATTHAQITCPVCAEEAGGGKFCQSCGTCVTAQRACAQCRTALSPSAKFCGECGTRG